MKLPRLSLGLAASLLLLLVCPVAAQDDGRRNDMDLERIVVLLAALACLSCVPGDVALSPDGQWLVFTMLGHLFRVPVEGGTAEQLTFGPYYDTDHAISPDGSRVAFVSDRDGSAGNVFVLELASGKITQVTHESWAGRPRWAPDGQALVYLRLVRQAWRWAVPFRYFGSGMPAHVCRVALAGGEPETLVAPLADVRSVFHLPDGRVGWAIVEPAADDPDWPPFEDTDGGPWETRIQVMDADGTVSTLRTLDGVAAVVVASPEADGLYVRRWRRRSLQQDLLFVPVPDGPERRIVAVTGISRGDFFGGQPQFAVANDNAALYVGHLGRLWKVTLPRGERAPIPFRARVTLEVREPLPPPRWTIPEPGRSAHPRSIQSPWLSPDGQRLLFLANRSVWEQPLTGGPVRRLVDEAVGLAYSPDGRQLAFLRGEEEVRVVDLAGGPTRTVASGDFYPDLIWSLDGEHLILTDHDEDDDPIVVAVNVSDGTKKVLEEGVGLEARHKTRVRHGDHWHRGLYGVSPDGQWFAFRPPTRLEIRVVPLSRERVTTEDARLLSSAGGNAGFTFTHDSSAVVYATGNRVWRQPLDGGKREEIPVRLELKRPTPPPVLLRRVRVLDFAAGRFGPETSLLIQEGRIQWIGSERGPQLPQGTVTLDAAGRFAIPGLFDMHVHNGSVLKPPKQKALLAYGVTSVRDMGGYRVAEISHVADWSTFTSEPVPRVFYAGATLRQGWVSPVHVYDEDDARTQVRMQKAWGVQFIKLYVTLPWPLQRAAADEARRLGLPVAAHGRSVERIVKGVTLGFAALTHSAPCYDDVLRLLAAAATWWDPTLGRRLRVYLIALEEPERLDDPKLRAFASEKEIRWIRRAGGLGEKYLRGRWVGIQRTIGAAYRRGVRLLPGTDAGGYERPAGASLHWELEFFAEAGIPPLEVLRIATQEAAAAVGADEDLGTLEVSKLADIVLLDANPMEDIKNTQTIWRVIKGGWVFDPKELAPPGSTYASQ